MKRIKLVAEFLLFFIAEARSQELPVKHNKFHFGLIGSINVSTLDIASNTRYYASQPSEENIPKIGFKTGAFVNYDLSKHFFLSSGLSYVTNNTKIKYPIFALGNSSAEYLTSNDFYSWIEMPVNINYTINPKSSCKIFVGSGFSIRRLLNATREIIMESSSSANIATGPERSITSALNDWSLKK